MPSASWNLVQGTAEIHIDETGLAGAAQHLRRGLCIVHPGTVVINDKVRIVKNARIHVCVNIGAAKDGAPMIGDDVYIGPGAKIYGNIVIGDCVTIGANAVANRNFGSDQLLWTFLHLLK